MNVKGYVTTFGTKFLAHVLGKGNAASTDAVPVARLREVGAIILAKTNMHEVTHRFWIFWNVISGIFGSQWRN